MHCSQRTWGLSLGLFGAVSLVACTGSGERDSDEADSVISLESAGSSGAETDGGGSGGSQSGGSDSGGTDSGSDSGGSNSDGDSSNNGTVPKFDVGNETGGIAACEVQQPTVDFVEPTLIFVLDKSGSMTNFTFDAGPAGNITRWNALHNTVSTLVNQYQDTVLFGSKLFPSADVIGACNVDAGLDVDPALNNGAAVLASIPAAGADIEGNTPGDAAMLSAAAVVQNYDLAASPTAVMFVLDGGVNCNGDINSTAAPIADLWDNYNVPTYVIGVDISSGLVAAMNTYAEAGGVPRGMPGDAERFYNAVNTDELEDFMDEIVGQILTCRIDLDSEPDHPDLTEVSVDGVDYPLITQAECENGAAGWYWSAEFNELLLCGSACDSFKEVQSANVEFFCPQG